MYIYDIGYNTYEENENIQLYHEKKFSEEEFEDVVAKATISILKGYKIKKERSITFQDILHEVVEKLIKNFGFKEVKFDSRFGIFGWADILDEKDWEHDRDEQLNRLTKSIRKKK